MTISKDNCLKMPGKDLQTTDPGRFIVDYYRDSAKLVIEADDFQHYEP